MRNLGRHLEVRNLLNPLICFWKSGRTELRKLSKIIEIKVINQNAVGQLFRLGDIEDHWYLAAFVCVVINILVNIVLNVLIINLNQSSVSHCEGSKLLTVRVKVSNAVRTFSPDFDETS